MQPLNIADVFSYVEDNIGTFHQKRLQNLDKLKLSRVLKRKNPYLFKAKNILTAEQIVRNLMDAHLSSNEETLFGDWLEGLAIFINERVYGGRKSGIRGIDLEFERDNVRYLVTIKSGPNWANSSQIAKMREDFKTAQKTLRTSGASLNVVAVNGCCYGKDSKPDKGDYFKYCGQQFWEFISGEPTLFLDIIDPLGHRAKEKNNEFITSYSRKINLFTREFMNNFCDEFGDINWHKLVAFNAAK